MGHLIGLISLLLQLLVLAILASVILSWLRLAGLRISPYHPAVRIIEETAGLVLRPIRRYLPVAGGGLDFSPLVAILLIEILQRVILHAL